MKTFILIFTLVLGSFAQAADNFGRGTYNYTDKDVADVRVVVSDIGETMDLVNVQIYCHDRRTHKTGVEPKWESPEELKNLSVCLFRPRGDAYDSNSKTLTLHYSLSSPRPSGQMVCNSHVKTAINLRDWCAAWQP